MFLLIICVFYKIVTATLNSNDTRNIIEYELGDVLQFSCSVANSKWAKFYQIRHELDGVNITIPDNQTMFQPTYTITAHDIDHDSKIYCIRTQECSDGKSQILKEMRMKSVSDELSAKCEIIHDEDNSPYQNCIRRTSMNRKDVINRLNQIQDKAMSLKKANSNCVYYCVNLSKSIGANYKREIQKKIKYSDVHKHRSWRIIAVGAEAVVNIILMAILIYVWTKRQRHADIAAPTNEEEINTPPTQLIYVELELPNRTPSLAIPVMEQTPYAQVIGYLR